MKNYDIIIIGAGSVGVPTALALGAAGVKTLVLDKNASAGQGENKRAIGGIRATHSDPGKILTCLRSLEIFSAWQQKEGDDIDWNQGGYCFPVYRENEEKALKGILPIQKKYGLEIDFYGPDKIKELVPGISPEGLIGGTFSPNDGNASPMLSLYAFFRKAVKDGVEFRFREMIKNIKIEQGRVTGVVTEKAEYHAPIVIDAAGPYSRELCQTVGVDIPVIPDSHEGAITEPVEPFFQCMVVDLRPAPGTKNYYFYQNKLGQIVFCITPDPPILGTDTRETSFFLLQVSARMVKLIPRLKNLRVRRTWRGLYPMSPDGFPLVGWSRDVKGLLHATAMCGQGYMLGPGLGEVISRMIIDKITDRDKIILENFSLYRKAGGEEKLK